MGQILDLEKLKPILIKLPVPISSELENVLDAKPVVMLKNLLFSPSRYFIMKLDSLENLKDLPEEPNYQVRTFRSGDEELWVRLIKRSFGQHFPADVSEISQHRDLDPNGFFFLKHGNEFVGTVYAMKMPFQGGVVGCVHRLCVVPEHREKGLGRYLALYALHYFRKIGLPSAILDVNETNSSAIKIYLSLGFKPV